VRKMPGQPPLDAADRLSSSAVSRFTSPLKRCLTEFRRKPVWRRPAKSAPRGDSSFTSSAASRLPCSY
jgi:hypothetical protein